jgi:hypothetical protein
MYFAISIGCVSFSDVPLKLSVPIARVLDDSLSMHSLFYYAQLVRYLDVSTS